MYSEECSLKQIIVTNHRALKLAQKSCAIKEISVEEGINIQSAGEVQSVCGLYANLAAVAAEFEVPASYGGLISIRPVTELERNNRTRL